MRTIDIVLPSTEQEITIVPLYDMHLGAGKCNEELLKRKIALANTCNAYFIVGGDTIDNALPDSVASASCYEQIPPQEQINKAVAYLEPIKDRILFICNGNHEERTYKKTGIDIGMCIASRLGLCDRFNPVSGLIFLEWGTPPSKCQSDYRTTKHNRFMGTIYVSHGAGGGRTVGAKANTAQRFGEIVDADICIVGHTHQLLAFPKARYTVDRRKHTVVLRDQLVVNADSCLGYEPYAERLGLPPASQRFSVITWEAWKLPKITF